MAMSKVGPRAERAIGLTVIDPGISAYKYHFLFEEF